MVSYVEVLKKDEQFAMCELEMVWTVESRKMNYLPNQTRVVYVPLEKFKKFTVNEGDVFVALHDDQSNKNTIISVCARDDEARAKRRALKKRDVVQV